MSGGGRISGAGGGGGRYKWKMMLRVAAAAGSPVSDGMDGRLDCASKVPTRTCFYKLGPGGR